MHPVSASIAGNDDVGSRDLLNILDSVTLPDGRIFDIARPLVLAARASDRNPCSSEGREAPGWLQRTCFDDAVTCNEASNGYWRPGGGISEEVFLAI